MTHLYAGKKKKRDKGLIAAAVLFVLMALLLFFVARTVQDVNRGGQAEALESAIRRAAVTCYALEGRYPATLAYLQEHYGITVNSARFHVRYDVLGANIMPDIAVTARGGG